MSVQCTTCGKEFKSKKACASHQRVHKSKDNSSNSTDNPGNMQRCDMQDRLAKLENAVLNILAKKSDNSNSQTNQIDETRIRALQLLDEGHSPVDIMLSLKIQVEDMKKILEDYNTLYSLIRPGRSQAEYYLNVARLFGEQIRDVCPEYNEESGVCNFYNVYDIDPELRRSCPGMFKGVGGKTRFHVLSHPEICTLCRRGVRRVE